MKKFKNMSYENREKLKIVIVVIISLVLIIGAGFFIHKLENGFYKNDNYLVQNIMILAIKKMKVSLLAKWIDL